MNLADDEIAANMSGITTTQSKIAEDLDAFDSASWFTSAYLVRKTLFLLETYC